MGKGDAVRILGSNFTVEFIDDRDSNDMGTCAFRNQTIKLQSGMTAEATMETLLHEMIECANVKGELDLEHYKITSLTTMIYSMFVDNGVDLSPLLRGVK
jgi:hypothetical protein